MNMNLAIPEIVFYVFSLVMVASAIMVISSRNPVYSALFLVLTFFSAAAIWLLLEAEFLAVVLIVVYVGAVMVLFLFVVMMLDINLVKLSEGFIRYLPMGITAALIMAAEFITVLWTRGRFGQAMYPEPARHPALVRRDEVPIREERGCVVTEPRQHVDLPVGHAIDGRPPAVAQLEKRNPVHQEHDDQRGPHQRPLSRGPACRAKVTTLCTTASSARPRTQATAPSGRSTAPAGTPWPPTSASRSDGNSATTSG